MNRYIKYFFIYIATLFIIGIGEIYYIKNYYIDIDCKKEFVNISTMPDISISTEAHFIRHRSITDIFEVFGLGPSLLPYFPSDFVYSPPPYFYKKVEN